LTRQISKTFEHITHFAKNKKPEKCPLEG